jgi:hypothetical protein
MAFTYHQYKLSLEQGQSIVQGLNTGALLTADVLDTNNVVPHDSGDTNITLKLVHQAASDALTNATSDRYIVSLVTDNNHPMQELNVAAIHQAINTQYSNTQSNLIFRYVAL